MDRKLLDDLKRVTGKQNILFELADAADGHPQFLQRPLPPHGAEGSPGFGVPLE
jgi:hypothetical protein